MVFSPMVGWLALMATLTTAPDASAEKWQAVTLSGKVVDLAAWFEAEGIECDSGPIAKQVVLIGQDGTITPLLSDEASRALFLDKRLRDRRVEIRARRFPGLPYVQVVSFRVEEEGKLRTPEYFCEVCTISVRYPQVCPCCQGSMDLRMRPEPR